MCLEIYKVDVEIALNKFSVHFGAADVSVPKSLVHQ